MQLLQSNIIGDVIWPPQLPHKSAVTSALNSLSHIWLYILLIVRKYASLKASQNTECVKSYSLNVFSSKLGCLITFKSLFRVSIACFKSLYSLIKSFANSQQVTRLFLLIYLYRMAHGIGFRAVGSFFRISATFANTCFHAVVQLLVLNKKNYSTATSGPI